MSELHSEKPWLLWDAQEILPRTKVVRKSVAVFDPFERYTPSKPGPVASFVTEHEARQLARVNRYGQ